MATSRQCRTCGRDIPLDAPRGLCPKCLLRRVAETFSGGPKEGPGKDTGGEWPLPMVTLLAEHLPQFDILGLIGSGGMANVYHARQHELSRDVALKVIRAGMVSEELLRRFHDEAEALGRLEHPGIARIYEYGRVNTELGPHPYFVLELITGVAGERAPTLTAYADLHDLGVRQRLLLLAKVAEAIHHAHQKGIIHRDLKPGNILVDEDGQPKILDFGVARLTDQDVKATTLQTDVGQLIGTLAYMSPEQAGGDPRQLDTRSDVYSLGVIGYELLSGKLPYDVGQRVIYEAVRIIREEDPTRLSAINRTLRGDIETILLKSLAKEKARRYQSAAEFATDIQRYLRDEPVMARQPSAWYQLRKFARRNKAMVAGATALLAVLLAGMVTTHRQAVKASREARRATAAEAVAEQEAARSRAAAQQARRRQYTSDMALAYQSWRESAHGRATELVERHRARPGEVDERGWEWYYLLSLLNQDLRSFSDGGGAIHAMAWLGGSNRVAAASDDGAVRIWDPDKGVLVRRHDVATCAVQCLSWDALTGRLAAGGGDGLVRTWNPATWDDVRVFPGHEGPVLAVAWSPDGQWLASGGEDCTVRVWDVDQGTVKTLLEATDRPVHALAWSATGDLVLSGHREGERSDNVGLLVVWDMEHGHMLSQARLDSGTIHALMSCPWGEEVLVGQAKSKFRLWDLMTEETVHMGIEDSGASVFAVAWSPDGERYATAGDSRVIRIWAREGPDNPKILAEHEDTIRALAWSPYGRRLVSGDDQGVIRVWDSLAPDDRVTVCAFSNWINSVQWAPDGRRLAVANWLNPVDIWDGIAGEPWMTLTGHENRVWCAAWSPMGDRLASVGHDRTVRIWDMATGENISTFHDLPVSTLWAEWDPEGDRVAAMYRDGRREYMETAVVVWDTRSGTGTRIVEGLQSMANRMDCSSSGLLAIPAYAPSSQVVRVWNIYTGAEESPFVATADMIKEATMSVSGKPEGRDQTRPPGPVMCVAWKRDGSQLAAGDWHDNFTIWDTETRSVLHSVHAHVGSVQDIGWSPDGRRLATASWDRTVKLHSPVSGEEVFSLRGGDLPVLALGWSPDGKRLAAGGRNGHVMVWDASRGYALESERTQKGPAADQVAASRP